MCRTLALCALICAPSLRAATSLEQLVARMYADAKALKPEDACFQRYVVWPDEGMQREHVHFFLTHARANLSSRTGAFYAPARIAPNLYRLDARNYKWEDKLHVWERFAGLDPYFHMRLKFLKQAKYKQYWPGGLHADGKEYSKQPYNLDISVGAELDVGAMWVDPLVKSADGVFSYYDELRRMLHTEVPFVFGPWWFVQTARQLSIRNKEEGTGPYDWLGIKKRDDMFKLAAVDEKAARAVYAAWQAAVEQGTSGISQQGRIVVLLRGATGFVWGTLDVFAEKDRSVIKRNLRPGELKHNAEEWLWHLPNGLQGEALFNNLGATQASAPPEIGGDKSPLNVGNDPRVHTGLCSRCHGVDKDGLKDINDWVRRTHSINRNGRGLALQNITKEDKVEFDSLYFRDINRHLVADRAEYAHAVAQLTATKDKPKGFTVAEFTEVYVKEGWNRYVEERVTLQKAAAYMFTTPAVLKSALTKYSNDRGGSDLVVNVYTLDTPGTLSVSEFEASYGFMQTVVRGLKIPELIKKVK